MTISSLKFPTKGPRVLIRRPRIIIQTKRRRRRRKTRKRTQRCSGNSREIVTSLSTALTNYSEDLHRLDL